MENAPSPPATPGTKQESLSIPALVMLVAAFVGFIAVYYHWFSYTLPIPPSAGGTLTVYRNGFADVSGTIAAISAGVAFAGASIAMILTGEGSRRVGIVIGLLGGLALIGSALLGMAHASSVGAGLLGSTGPIAPGLHVAQTGKAAIGLYISLASGAVVVIAGALALRAVQSSGTNGD